MYVYCGIWIKTHDMYQISGICYLCGFRYLEHVNYRYLNMKLEAWFSYLSSNLLITEILNILL